MNDLANPIAHIADPFEAMLGFQLRRASAAVMAALASELEPLGMRPSEATLLMLIGANPGLTQSHISRALGARAANLVPLIDKLQQMSALDRAPGKGRAVALSLSTEGEQLYALVRDAFARHEARITRSLPVERKAELIAMLRQACADACGHDAD